MAKQGEAKKKPLIAAAENVGKLPFSPSFFAVASSSSSSSSWLAAVTVTERAPEIKNRGGVGRG